MYLPIILSTSLFVSIGLKQISVPVMLLLDHSIPCKIGVDVRISKHPRPVFLVLKKKCKSIISTIFQFYLNLIYQSQTARTK